MKGENKERWMLLCEQAEAKLQDISHSRDDPLRNVARHWLVLRKERIESL